MSFSQAGTLITQSGTDADLSGVVGLTGVTVTSRIGGFVTYDFGSNKLRVNGDLTIGGNGAYKEQLIIGTDANNTPPDIDVSGTLTIGCQYTYGADSETQQAHRLIYEPGENKGYNESRGTSTNAFLRVNSGGTLNWISGTIDCWGGWGFLAGSTINIGVAGMRLKPVLDMTRARRNGDQTQIVYNFSEFTSVYGLIYIGDLGRNANPANGVSWAQLSTPLLFKGYEPRFVSQAFSGSNDLRAGTYTVEDYAGRFAGKLDLQKKVRIGEAADWIFRNSATGSDMVFSSSTGDMSAYMKSDLIVTIKDTAGAGVDGFKLYLEDSLAVPYSGVTAGGGLETIEDILLAQSLAGTAAITRFFGTDDESDVFGFKYGRAILQAGVTLRGVGGATARLVSVVDVNISEAVKATVDAYTTLDNAREVYDREASYLEDNWGTYVAHFLMRSGNQVELAAKTLVIDAAAASVFAYNGTDTITIKSSTFTGGAEASTGGVATRNGTLLSGGTFDCDVEYDSGPSTTLTNVICTGAMDFTQAGTYTLVGCALAEVTNSSGGSVILNIDGMTTITLNTGPDITVVPPAQIQRILLPGILDGARVRVYDQTAAAELYNAVVSGGGGFDESFELGTDTEAGNVLRIIVTYASGGVYKVPIGLSVAASDSTYTKADTMDDWEEPNSWSLDHTTVTECQTDYLNVQVEVTDPDDIGYKSRVAIFITGELATEDGIRNWVSLTGVPVIDWKTTHNVEIEVNVADVEIINQKATSKLAFMDEFTFDWSDGIQEVDAVIGSSIIWRNPLAVAIAETGVSGLTAPESAKLLSLDTSNLDATVSSRASQATADADHDVTQAAIGALNNLSSGDVEAAAGNALATYDPPTAAELAAAVAPLATSAEVGALNNLSSGDVETAAGNALATYDPPTKAEMDAGFAALNDPTVAQIVAGLQAVAADFKADVSALATSAEIASLNNPSVADIVSGLQAVANDFKADVSALASQASIDAIDAIVDAIKLKTDNLPASPAASSDAADALTAYDPPTKAELDSGFAALNNISVADVVSGMLLAADSFKADVSALATSAEIAALNNVSVADVVNGMLVAADDFKADVSALATEANLDEIGARIFWLL